MKKELKGAVIGAMVSAMIFGGTNVFAETQQTIEAFFGRVKLVVDGQTIDKETLLYNGTTYVPLKVAAEALGKEVSYDNATKTAYIDAAGTNRTFGTVETKQTENERLRELWNKVTVDSSLYNDTIQLAKLEGAISGLNDTYSNKYENVSFGTDADKKAAAEALSAGGTNIAATRDELGRLLADGTLGKNNNLSGIYDEYVEILSSYAGIFAHRANILADASPEEAQVSQGMIDAYFTGIEECIVRLRVEGTKLGMPLGSCLDLRFK